MGIWTAAASERRLDHRLSGRAEAGCYRSPAIHHLTDPRETRATPDERSALSVELQDRPVTHRYHAQNRILALNLIEAGSALRSRL